MSSFLTKMRQISTLGGGGGTLKIVSQRQTGGTPGPLGDLGSTAPSKRLWHRTCKTRHLKKKSPKNVVFNSKRAKTKAKPEV